MGLLPHILRVIARRLFGKLRYNKGMQFSELAHEFEQIEKTSLRNEMMRLLADLMKRVSETEIAKTIYLALGGLRPKYDRLEFNLAEKMVVRAIAITTKTAIEDVGTSYQKTGDLGELLQTMREGAESSPLSIEQVYERLETIAREQGTGSQERKLRKLSLLLGEIDAVSGKYVVRIVLGKLRLGFSDKTILDALSYMETGSKEASELLLSAYQLAPDVGELARLVKTVGTQEARRLVNVELGRPVIPALAQRLKTAEEMIAKMGRVIVEPKFDGTRVQIHIDLDHTQRGPDGGQNGLFEEEKQQIWVKTFTRNLDENSEMFPELLKIGRQLRAKTLVLDSEAVGYDPKTGKLVPFQMTITRKRKHAVVEAQANVPLRFFVFDVMYKDGVSLLEEPLYKRREILKSVIKTGGEGDALVIDESIETANQTELREYHKRQLENGLEGVLVKKIDGKYEPGRQGFNWVKFKEEEGTRGKLSDTVDAVVMGYYKGKGKRQKFGLGAFLVGVRDGEKMLTIAKIGTGLSDEQFRELFVKLKNHESRVMNKSYVVTKALWPDVWVEPAIVVEVAADEVTKSPTHSSGMALRFPRLVRIREDKGVEQSTSMDELGEIA
ncbi:MAG: putative DNA ligase [Microgenomates group bacterium GW2011_GWF2_47_9]|nr:MAG: putative DNA ligase [Microgenomates group bacterium GW2011_GWF2_47_9]